MPTLPKNSKRPAWMGERKPFERMREKNEGFYNSTAWRNAAKAHKAANPLCVNHKTCKGVAYITDHILPVNQGGEPYAFDNLQSLCKRCNASKTGKQAYKRPDKDDPHRGA